MALSLRIFVLVALLQCIALVSAANYKTKSNIYYYPATETDAYIKERCFLDVYYPEGAKDVTTVVFFHGGNLVSGDRYIPGPLKNRGVAVVAVNYRLSPRAKNPSYTLDAAQAVAWTFNNIEKYGGSRDKIIVAGHSAGGYLSTMLGFDKSLLAKHNIDANKLAGIGDFSGHAITHATIREENGRQWWQPSIDKYAPIYHIRKDTAPIIIISGEPKLEYRGRGEENAYFWRMLKEVKHNSYNLTVLPGVDHGGVVDPGMPAFLDFFNL